MLLMKVQVFRASILQQVAAVMKYRSVHHVGMDFLFDLIIDKPDSNR
jgi:hypothetical protein